MTIFLVYPGTVCVLIQVEIEDGNDTYIEEFHITSSKVIGSSQKPIYKSIDENYYIYYLPDAYGWRYGQIDGNTFDDFDYESKHNSVSWRQSVLSVINI